MTTGQEHSRTSRGRSCLTVMAVVIGYLLSSALLLMLPTGFIGPMFVGGGFILVFVIGLHYLVWGRWMSQLLAEKDKTDAD